MEDIYYNKYIKYKTKYLELKELNGGGAKIDSFKRFLGFKTAAPAVTAAPLVPKAVTAAPLVPKVVTTAQLAPARYNLLFNTEEKIFNTYFDILVQHGSKLLTYNNNIYYIPDNNQTYFTEQLLLQIILPELYIHKNEIDYQQIIINIYKSFCNTINTYRNNINNIKISEILSKKILSNNVLQLSIIIENLEKIKTSYKIDLPVLKNTIREYFAFLNSCIEKKIQFNNFNICENSTVYLNSFLNNPFFYNNKNEFMVERLISPVEKLLYAVHIADKNN